MKKTFYCPTEKTKRIFVRVDNKNGVVEHYQCTDCEEIYGEATLAHPDGEGGDLVKLLREKIEIGELKI